MTQKKQQVSLFLITLFLSIVLFILILHFGESILSCLGFTLDNRGRIALLWLAAIASLLPVYFFGLRYVVFTEIERVYLAFFYLALLLAFGSFKVFDSIQTATTIAQVFTTLILNGSVATLLALYNLLRCQQPTWPQQAQPSNPPPAQPPQAQPPPQSPPAQPQAPPQTLLLPLPQPGQQVVVEMQGNRIVITVQNNRQ
ncbi:MAG: hypothetical protein RQ839_11635 [Thermoproteus sp.]|nr:hypothetical protein [Thermoproteus sp.]